MLTVIKFVIVFFITIFIMGATYYGIADRFDIVACLLMGINGLAMALMEIKQQEAIHKTQYYKNRKREKVYTVPNEEQMEENAAYQFMGYTQGMADYLNVLKLGFNVSDPTFQKFVKIANEHPDIKGKGRFTEIELVDKSRKFVFIDKITG